MNIEIKSTSYLIPNNSSWESLHKNNKLKFAEYNNIFNNTKFNQKTECEIFVLFLKDIIDYYKVLKNINKNEIKKILKNDETLFRDRGSGFVEILSYRL
jgi:hypothetical protein